MEAEFAEAAAYLGTNAKLTSFLAEPAMAALKGGDASTHNQVVAERASARRVRRSKVGESKIWLNRAAKICRAISVSRRC